MMASLPDLWHYAAMAAVVFGAVQALVLYAIYRTILRKERSQRQHHDALAAEHTDGAKAAE